VDYSPRHRYRARRQLIAARRRRFTLIAGLLAVLLVAGGAFALRRSSARPVAVAETPAAPTSATVPTVTPAVSAATSVVAAPAPAIAEDAAPAVAPAAPADFFDDRRLTYEPGFYVPQTQALLDAQPGPLKSLALVVGGRRHTFAEVLIGQTSYYSVNPKVILALLELQSRLLSAPGPSADQLGWAAGYQGENGNRRGLQAQVRWAVKQILTAKRDYPQYAPLTYADNSSAPPPPGMSLGKYAIARALAPTTSPDRLPALLDRVDAGTEDEILSGLDRELAGKTVILVTHEPDIAAYAKASIVLKDGRVLSLTEGQP